MTALALRVYEARHRTPEQPARECANQCWRSLDHHIARTDGRVVIDLAGPDALKVGELRPDDQIRIESGRLQADGRLTLLEDKPESLAVSPDEIELDDGSLRRQQVLADATPYHPGHQQRVLFIRSWIPEDPSHCPGAKSIEDTLKVAPGRCELVRGHLRAIAGPPFDDPCVLQLTKPAYQQRPRDTGKPAFDFIEVMAAGQKFPDDQR